MSDLIRTTTVLELHPLAVPNFVRTDEDGASGIPITELSQEALDALAERFLKDLYAKAKKQTPWGRT